MSVVEIMGGTPPEGEDPVSGLLEITRTDLDDGHIMFTTMCPACGNPTRFDQIGAPGPAEPYLHTVESAERSAREWAESNPCDHRMRPLTNTEKGLLW